LGFSYDFIELFTGAYVPLDENGKETFRKSLSNEALQIFLKLGNMAQDIHNRNKHKLMGPANL